MRYVATENLCPGMISQKCIYDENGRRLLAANHEITENLIYALKRIDFPGLYIYDKFSPYEKLGDFYPLSRQKSAGKALREMNLDAIIYYATDMVEELANQDQNYVELSYLNQNNHDVYNHSINVAMLSAIIGFGLGMPREQVEELTLSAMLHDIGKTMVPRDILYKPGRYTSEEYEVMKQHSQFGYDMLYDNPRVTVNARCGVLFHHENSDGSGYPRGLTNPSIPLFARIIHVCDVYDAMVQKRVYKEAKNPADVLEYMMEQAGIMFDYRVMDTFLRVVVVYPVGTDVVLSDGRVARVIANNPEDMFRPVVMVKSTMEEIHLDQESGENPLYITETEQIYHEGDGLGKTAEAAFEESAFEHQM